MKKILYISGEESQAQIKLRANRMGKFTPNLLLLCETSLETIRGVIEKERPELVIIDSIQTMYSEDVSSAPGSVSQVRESTNIFMQLAKGLCKTPWSPACPTAVTQPYKQAMQEEGSELGAHPTCCSHHPKTPQLLSPSPHAPGCSCTEHTTNKAGKSPNIFIVP